MPRPWAVDLSGSDPSCKDLPKPPGYSEYSREEQEEVRQRKKMDQVQLKLKKAKEMGWSPAKSFMMTGFMLWMSGNGVHIFSIMITFYAIYNPIKSAFGVATQFKRFEDPQMKDGDKTTLLLAKATFVGMNFLAMCGALYKMSMMGLLPTTPSDWVSFLAVPKPVQFSAAGF